MSAKPTFEVQVSFDNGAFMYNICICVDRSSWTTRDAFTGVTSGNKTPTPAEWANARQEAHSKAKAFIDVLLNGRTES